MDKKFEENIIKDIDLKMNQITLKAVKYLKSITPVKTGLLRASQKSQKVKPLFYVIGTNVEYAPYIELKQNIYLRTRNYIIEQLDKTFK